MKNFTNKNISSRETESRKSESETNNYFNIKAKKMNLIVKLMLNESIFT